MENSFSSSIIQALKDNFVGKVIKNNNVEGEITDIKVMKSLHDTGESWDIEVDEPFFEINKFWYSFNELEGSGTTVNSLPAKERKDSIVKILRGNTSFAAKGAEVVVLAVFADETCSSGTCALVEYKGSKYEICNDFIDSDNYAQFN